MVVAAVIGIGGCAGPRYIVPVETKMGGVAEVWTPTPDDVARAERGLRRYLRSLGPKVRDYGSGPLWQHLGERGRQYFGVMRDGRRVIYIHLFDVNSPFYQRGDEQKGLVTVHDCGNCTAGVYFDLERGLYSDYWESGR